MEAPIPPSLRNLSLAAGKSEPNLPNRSTRPRLRSIRWVREPLDEPEVYPLGPGTHSQPPIRPPVSSRLGIHCIDRAWQWVQMSGPLAYKEPDVVLSVISDQARLYMQGLTPGRYFAVWVITEHMEKAIAVFTLESGEHNPEAHLGDTAVQSSGFGDGVSEPLVIIEDGAIQQEAFSGGYNPAIHLEDQSTQAAGLFLGRLNPAISLADKSQSVHTIANGDFRPMVFLNEKAVNLIRMIDGEHFLEVHVQQLLEKAAQTVLLDGGTHDIPISEISVTDKGVLQIVTGTGTFGAASQAFNFSGSIWNRFSGGAATTTPAAWTQAAWIKVADISVSHTVFMRSNNNPDANYSHCLRHSSTFAAYLYDGGFKGVTGTTLITPGIWYHVVVCATNSGSLRLYVNGLPDGPPIAVGTMWTGGNDWWIARKDGGVTASFVGALADCAIWSRELSVFEIFALAGAPIGAPSTLHAANLILYCPMQEGVIGGTIVGDWAEDGASTLIQTRTGTPGVVEGPSPTELSLDPNLITSSAPGFWLEAEYLTLNNGDPVAVWTDHSGNANDVSEATNRPIFQTGIINSLPALLFDGVNDNLSRLSLTQGDWAQPGTMLAIYYSTNPEGVNSAVWDGSPSKRLAYLTQVFAAPDSIHLYAGTSAYGVISFPKNKWSVTAVTYNGASSSVWLNGIKNPWVASVGALPLGAIRIGAEANMTAGYFFKGWIACVIGWPRLLPDQELSQVSMSLMLKYGIT